MKIILPGILMVIIAALVLAIMKGPSAPKENVHEAQGVVIMTAASASDLMSDIAAGFKSETGIQVVVVSGGSNALATQILSGAPADLFLSASEQWAAKVAEKGFSASSKPLLTNDLVLIVPANNPADVATPADLLKPGVQKIALAGDNVPCGIYAKQAFESLGIFDELNGQSKIVRGQDVRTALAFVERAEAQAGVVYSTDAKISSRVKTVYSFDPATFDRIVYPLLLLKAGEKNPSAVKFQEWLVGPKAKNAYLKFGFKLIDSPG